MKIRKFVALAAIMAVVGSMGACKPKAEKAGEERAKEEGKTLVCYFSATGTTADAARRIAYVTGGTLHEIKPEQPYTEADLDWRDTLSRSYVEMHNPASRPAIVDSLPDLADYTVVYIGYPNWWNTHPTIINTFIEANDLKGKKIVPFMTSGGNDISNSEKILHETYPELTFGGGLLVNDVSDDDLRQWARQQ